MVSLSNAPSGAGGAPIVHRCHVCGADACYGFTWPLARKNEEFWACTAHRAALEEMLARQPTLDVEPQRTLPLPLARKPGP